MIHSAKCRECGAPLPPLAKRCVNRKCRAWNLASKAKVEDHVVRLSEVTAQKVARVRTGLVDTVFGGGIARTSVNLLAGEPGAGKTTLCLMLSDIFLDYFPTSDVLYIANEQDPREIAETGERLRLRYMPRICVVKAMGGVTFDIGDIFLGYKPCLVLLDSITKWVGEDMALAVIMAQRLKDWAVKLEAPVIIVNQVTKDGDHAGRKQLEHAVDWAGMFEIMKDVTADDGSPLPVAQRPRVLASSKNRFGPAPEEQFYKMTERGLVEVTLGSDDDG